MRPIRVQFFKNLTNILTSPQVLYCEKVEKLNDDDQFKNEGRRKCDEKANFIFFECSYRIEPQNIHRERKIPTLEKNCKFLGQEENVLNFIKLMKLFEVHFTRY